MPHRVVVKHADMMLAKMLGEPEPEGDVVRVKIYTHGKVAVYSLDSIDTEVDGYYDSVNDLPVWMQERLAILLLMSAKPPTQDVDDVGRRIDETTFWLYR
jgi:hypothetical protein